MAKSAGTGLLHSVADVTMPPLYRRLMVSSGPCSNADVDSEAPRGNVLLENSLERTKWMTEEGYRQLLQADCANDP